MTGPADARSEAFIVKLLRIWDQRLEQDRRMGLICLKFTPAGMDADEVRRRLASFASTIAADPDELLACRLYALTGNEIHVL